MKEKKKKKKKRQNMYHTFISMFLSMISSGYNQTTRSHDDLRLPCIFNNRGRFSSTFGGHGGGHDRTHRARAGVDPDPLPNSPTGRGKLEAPSGDKRLIVRTTGGSAALGGDNVREGEHVRASSSGRIGDRKREL